MGKLKANFKIEYDYSGENCIHSLMWINYNGVLDAPWIVHYQIQNAILILLYSWP